MLNWCRLPRDGFCPWAWPAWPLKSTAIAAQTQLLLNAPNASLSLSAAIAELLIAKRAANRRERYLKSLKQYLLQFAEGREQSSLKSFTSADVEAWMNRYPGAYARQTWLSRLSTLFSFSVRRGYIPANPCDRVDRVSVDRNPPKILTPAQADLLLKIVPEMCRAYLICCLFVGIRPEETMRLDWSSVDLETKTIRVDGKTRQRRIVKLEPRASALLAACALRKGALTPSLATVCRFKAKMRAALGLAKFPQDLLRHTAASYLLALHGDAGKVATSLGNSSKVMLSHYHEPVNAADCALFWAVCPTMSGNVGLAADSANSQGLPRGRKAECKTGSEVANGTQIADAGGGAAPTAQRELGCDPSVQNAT